MSIEMIVLVCTLIVALLGGYISYRDQVGSRRRVIAGASIVFLLVSAFVGLEEVTRRQNTAHAAEQVERQWLLLREAYVGAVEFEVLAVDGFFQLAEFLEFVQEAEFSVDGVNLELDMPTWRPDAISFSEIFTIEALEKVGRIGIANAVIRSSRDGDTTDKFESVQCMASSFTTKSILSAWSAGERTAVVCSAGVRIPVTRDSIRLRDLSNSSNVSLQFLNENGLRCFGECKRIVVSVRLLFGRQGGVFEEMIEISPHVYLNMPSTFKGNVSSFDLTGGGVLSLAESHFKHSFGYRSRQNFPMTMGAFSWIYRHLTAATLKAKVIAIVWTTDSSPSEETLRNAVAPEYRQAAIPFGTSEEWCGFGEAAICWYRFVMAELRD